MLAEGVDPRVEGLRVKEDGKRKAQEAVAAVENRFEARVMEYLRRHCKDHRQVKGTARMIDNLLMPHWRDRRIERSFARHQDADPRHCGAVAVRCAEHVRGVQELFRLGARADGIHHRLTRSRDQRQEADRQKKPRQRVLTDDEIRKFWVATGKLGYPYQHLYRLIALTGARLHEASDASWSEFDFDRRIWVIPPERFKSDCLHIVPLSNAVMQLIEEMPPLR